MAFRFSKSYDKIYFQYGRCMIMKKILMSKYDKTVGDRVIKEVEMSDEKFNDIFGRLKNKEKYISQCKRILKEP